MAADAAPEFVVSDSESRPILWMTWERHRRSRSISAQLGFRLVELEPVGGRIRRYLKNFPKTISLLKSLGSSDVIVVQAPSIVLALLSIAIRSIRRFGVVIDAHNAVVEQAEHAPHFLGWAYRKVIRSADRIIVTNEMLAGRVRQLGGRPMVLSDPIPRIHRTSSGGGSSPAKVVVISTWAADEPIGEVVEAANLLPNDIHVVITGRPKGAWAAAARRSGRISVPGFLSDAAYVDELSSASVVVDLTTREDCLVCGSYEAMALGLPMVLSDTVALRDLVGNAAIYCRNERSEIAKAIQVSLDQNDLLAENCRRRCILHRQNWQNQAEALVGEISALALSKK